jgi:hypothetical protein
LYQGTGFRFGACVTCLAAVVTLGTAASAAPVSIIGYDIAQTPRSGFGCWFHDYDGTVTNTGRTVSGSVVCSADGSQIANYSGACLLRGSGFRIMRVSPLCPTGSLAASRSFRSRPRR